MITGWADSSGWEPHLGGFVKRMRGPNGEALALVLRKSSRFYRLILFMDKKEIFAGTCTTEAAAKRRASNKLWYFVNRKQEATQ